MSTPAPAREPVTLLIAPVFKTNHQEVRAVARAAVGRLGMDRPTCLVEMSGGFGPDSSPEAPLLGEALAVLAAGGRSVPDLVVGWDDREYEHGDIEVAADVVRLVLGLRDRGISVVLLGPMVAEHEVWWYAGVGSQLADRLVFVADGHLTYGMPAINDVLRIGLRWQQPSRTGALLLHPAPAPEEGPCVQRLDDLVGEVLDLSGWLHQEPYRDDRRTYPGLHSLLGLSPNEEDLQLLDEVAVALAWDALGAGTEDLHDLRTRIEDAPRREDLELFVGLLHDSVTILHEHEAIFRRGLGGFGFWPDALLLVDRKAADLVVHLSARSLRDLVLVLLEVGSFTHGEDWPRFPLEIQQFFPDSPVRILQQVLSVASRPALEEMAVSYARAIDSGYGAAVEASLRGSRHDSTSGGS